MELAGKVVIVTGAASGIGAATARRFAAQGAHLVLVDKVSASDVLSQADGTAGKVSIIEGDLADVATAERALAAAAELGGVDVLINNAAIGVIGPVEQTSDEQMEAVWRINLLAGMRLARGAIPVMREKGGGSIQFTTALAGMYGMANSVAYSTSKAAIINLCKVLTIECSRDGIRSNCVSPGPVETPMLKGAIAAFGLSREAFQAASPSGRIATPEDVADAHLYLASSAARAVNGQVLCVDNGMYAGLFNPRPVG